MLFGLLIGLVGLAYSTFAAINYRTFRPHELQPTLMFASGFLSCISIVAIMYWALS